MSDPTITIEQMRAERDAARQESERLAAELEEANDINGKWHEEWEKDCSRELRRLADLTGFEWEVDGSPADVIREHIELTLQQYRQEADQNAALAEYRKQLLDGVFKCEDSCGACKWLSAQDKSNLSAPAALERVQREAAAKALEETVERLRSMGTDGASAYAIARNTAVAEMIVDIRKRAAELREASHG